MEEIPRKEQGAEAKLWKVPAKAKSHVCNQQIKPGTGILRSRKTKIQLSRLPSYLTNNRRRYTCGNFPCEHLPHK